MSKAKYIITRSFSASKSAIFFSTKKALICQLPEGWAKMTRTERIRYALEEFDPQSPEIAYYKGIGLLKFEHSPQSHGKAIAALNLALQLTDGKFWGASIELAKIYAKEHNYEIAFQVLFEAVQTLHNSITSDGYTSEEIKNIMLFNRKQTNDQQESLPDGLPNDHSEERLWLLCWYTSHAFAKVGDLKRAYTTLWEGKGHLETAISNNKIDFEYLKKLLLSKTSPFSPDEYSESSMLKHT